MRRFLVFVILIAIILSMGELIVRKRYGDGFLSLVDAQLHHTKRPFINIERKWGSGEGFRLVTNSLGWRDRIPNKKIAKVTEKDKRIIFLGDSFTEGIGYGQEYTFSGVTEEILTKRGFDYEVLNAGSASYSPLIEYMQLKRFLDKGYKADIVILFIDPSDVQDEAFYDIKYIYDDAGRPLRFKAFYYKHPFTDILNLSCLARSSSNIIKVFYEKIRKPFSNRQVSAENAEIAHNKNEIIRAKDLVNLDTDTFYKLRANWLAHEPSIQGWAKEGLQLIKENVKRVKRLCDENGILFICVIYPWPQELYINEDGEYYRILRDYFQQLYATRELFYKTEPSQSPSIYETAIISFCRRNSLNLINLYPEFIIIKDWYRLYIPNDIHLNKEGHRFVGKKIAEMLMQKMQ